MILEFVNVRCRLAIGDGCGAIQDSCYGVSVGWVNRKGVKESELEFETDHTLICPVCGRRSDYVYLNETDYKKLLEE
jgi:hypothetical protein